MEITCGHRNDNFYWESIEILFFYSLYIILGGIKLYKEYKEKGYKELENLVLKNDYYAINELGERKFQEGNYKEALEYFEKASKLGSDMAINNIGFYFLEIENNFEEAEKYFNKAIEKGNMIAINNLGVLNIDKNNYEEAKKYFLLAIDKKCSFAYNNLGGLYENVYQKYEEAEKLYQRCFEETEDTDCLINLAYLYLNYYENKNGAIKYLKLAISKGNKEADHVLFHVLNDEVCSCNND